METETNGINQILISEENIIQIIDDLRKEIMYDHATLKEDIIFVSVLKGSYMFASDLTKGIHFNNKKVHIDFVELSSYHNETTSSGNIIIKKDISFDPENKHIIILEDIVDTGNTVNWLKDLLSLRNPASVKVCCLLNKRSRREVDIYLDYVGFDCPDEFVVGYGMDYAEEYRTLPFIGILNSNIYNKTEICY